MAPVFDETELLERVDNDLAFLAETVQMLATDGRALMAEIRRAVAAGDAPAVGRAAHTLKGMISNFCSPAAQAARSSVEQVGKAATCRGAAPAVADAGTRAGRADRRTGRLSSPRGPDAHPDRRGRADHPGDAGAPARRAGATPSPPPRTASRRGSTSTPASSTSSSPTGRCRGCPGWSWSGASASGRGAVYIYVIMLTSRSDKSDIVSGIEAGADDFVSKPFDREELRVRLLAGERIVRLERTLNQQNAELRDANERIRSGLRAAARVQQPCSRGRTSSRRASAPPGTTSPPTNWPATPSACTSSTTATSSRTCSTSAATACRPRCSRVTAMHALEPEPAETSLLRDLPRVATRAWAPCSGPPASPRS